ncbi:MAG: polyprenyl synthetase family protein [Thermoguttaceae bacterium]|nr:polyprenyl synthetase family protein [Thermoguttaceae bacterium]
MGLETIFLPEWQERVEQMLRSSIARVAQSPHCARRLVDAMAYSLLAPGKRARPMLVILAAEAVTQAHGHPFERSLPPEHPHSQNILHAAAAIEMIHAYSLIHDDLPAMDNDDLRRGRATNHKQFDTATAILAGDALQPLAFSELAEIRPSTIAFSCMAALAHFSGALGMVAGQMDDVGYEKQLAGYTEIGEKTNQEKWAFLKRIHQRKTGALIRCALRLGATIAEATEVEYGILDQYGQEIGQMFQITDDLLDLRGDVAKLGKSTGKDASRGKLTYPGLLGVSMAEREAERCAVAAVQSAESIASVLSSNQDQSRSESGVVAQHAGENLRCLVRLWLERDH